MLNMLNKKLESEKTMNDKIESTPEAWDSGELGRDEEFVKKADFDETAFNEALELQMISIRLQKSLIEDLKAFAKIHKLGYQPLVKIILQRWVDGELKTLGNQIMRERLQELEEQEQAQIEENSAKKIAK